MIRIQQEVPTTIFEEPILQARLTQLFKESEEKLKSRMNEILIFLKERDFDVNAIDVFSYESISALFKESFFNLIANKAVKVTFETKGKSDIVVNILSLLSKEEIDSAIMGETLIYSFVNAIRSLAGNHLEFNFKYERTIILLYRKFLGIDYDFFSF